MSEQVTPVTELPVASTSVLKKIAKRTALVAVATVVVAGLYVKLTSNGTESETTETPSA